MGFCPEKSPLLEVLKTELNQALNNLVSHLITDTGQEVSLHTSQGRSLYHQMFYDGIFDIFRYSETIFLVIQNVQMTYKFCCWCFLPVISMCWPCMSL